MNSKLIALASAATMAVAAIAIPNQAEARWRGGNWWVPGAVVGGLALGVAVASRPYYYGPGYDGYAYSPGPYYDYSYGGYGPNDYEYNSSRNYYYGGSRYYNNRPYRNWTEF